MVGAHQRGAGIAHTRPRSGRRAGRSLDLAIPPPGTPENKLNTDRGATAGGIYDKAITGGIAAAQENALYGTMLQQLDAGLKTGTGFDMRKTLADALTTMGADPQKVSEALPNSTQSTLFTNASRALLLERAKALGANPSNAEDKIILSSIATSSNPTDALRGLIEWKVSKNNAAVQYGEGMHDHVDLRGGHPVTYAQEYARSNPSFALPSAPGAIGSPPPQAQAKPIDQAARDAANNAILKGAPKDAVKKRLQESGYDVSNF